MFGVSQSLQRRAFLTGATGFIGRQLVRQLYKDGWVVHAISRRMPTTEESKTATWYPYCGTYDSVLLALSTSQPDVVFHLASLFVKEHGSWEIDSVVDGNLRFGMQLLEAMQECNVRQLLNTGTNWQHIETFDYNPVNLYAATKQAFEAIIDYYCYAHNFEAITLKLYDTYGPNDSRGKLVPYLQECLRDGSEVNMTDGMQSIYLVHVEDVARAFTHACRHFVSSSHLRFGVCSEAPLTIRQVLEKLALAKNCRPKVKWGSKPSSRRTIMHPVYLPQLPGWRPIYSFPNGLI